MDYDELHEIIDRLIAVNRRNLKTYGGTIKCGKDCGLDIDFYQIAPHNDVIKIDAYGFEHEAQVEESHTTVSSAGLYSAVYKLPWETLIDIAESAGTDLRQRHLLY